MKARSFIFLGIIMLTYSLPWVTIGEQQFSPGQLVQPYIRFFLTKANVMKPNETTPHSMGDVFLYEERLRYLSLPHSEGGPRNQITFEVMGFVLVGAFLLLLIPTKFTQVIGYLGVLASGSAFLAAMMFLEGKTIEHIGPGLWANIGVSAALLIASFFL